MSNSVTVKPKALVPLTTPLQLKEATVRDYTNAAKRLGLPVDAQEIERQAVADCEVYDGVKRDAKPAIKREQTPEERAEIRRIRKEQLEREMAPQGMVSLDKVKVRRRRIKQMHEKSKRDSRWSLAKGRVLQICRGVRAPVGKVLGDMDATIRYMTATCEIPDLAYAVFRVRADLVVRDRMPRPGDEPNPFFGMSEEDAGNLLQRKIEDICDLSTGKLGSWRTPR